MERMIHASDARQELQDKSLLDIERETAKTWGARAAAAYQYARECEGNQRLRWIADAENYRQESVEHAAMTGDMEFIQQVVSDLDDARQGLSLTRER